MNIATRRFELVENPIGYAGETTIIKFNGHVESILGTYTGPNTVHGQVIMKTSPVGLTEMLYQSLTTDGELVLGRAEALHMEEENKPAIMHLTWQWLTGSPTSGISVWREISGADIPMS